MAAIAVTTCAGRKIHVTRFTKQLGNKFEATAAGEFQIHMPITVDGQSSVVANASHTFCGSKYYDAKYCHETR